MGAKDSPFIAIATIHYHLDHVAQRNPEKMDIGITKKTPICR